ncbi:hypothetical protein ILYODFUR_034658 [Ilyodon furcidens]|uniref:Uncharacterized protein n=1 Tax=Ilyodon furcidens TaxID=33524 RepID=A0ABV0TDJ3_9TELE
MDSAESMLSAGRNSASEITVVAKKCIAFVVFRATISGRYFAHLLLNRHITAWNNSTNIPNTLYYFNHSTRANLNRRWRRSPVEGGGGRDEDLPVLLTKGHSFITIKLKFWEFNWWINKVDPYVLPVVLFSANPDNWLHISHNGRRVSYKTLKNM